MPLTRRWRRFESEGYKKTTKGREALYRPFSCDLRGFSAFCKCKLLFWQSYPAVYAAPMLSAAILTDRKKAPGDLP